jgi:hypothetical protein
VTMEKSQSSGTLSEMSHFYDLKNAGICHPEHNFVTY